jgi:hypothetical protein
VLLWWWAHGAHIDHDPHLHLHLAIFTFGGLFSAQDPLWLAASASGFTIPLSRSSCCTLAVRCATRVSRTARRSYLFELAALVHTEEDVAPAHKLPVNVDLRDRWPRSGPDAMNRQ